MQLVAYGAQDIYLTGNPMITYFKVVYRRHTNFAMEPIQQTFNGNANFGSKVTALMSRNGDLVSGVTLEATLPALDGAADRYIDDVGHHLIQEVSIDIGGQPIDKHYADWLEVWAQLTVPAGHEAGYRRMIGQTQTSINGTPGGLQVDTDTAAGAADSNVAQDRKVYVPIQFWFCRNVGLALPLIALQYHEVRMTVLFARSTHLICTDDASTPTGTTSSLADAALWVDYIYLDTDERRRFAQISHEYLIEQLQFTGDETYDASVGAGTSPGSLSISLNFNHPVKELIWVCRESSRTTRNLGQWSNYTTVEADADGNNSLAKDPSTPGTGRARNPVATAKLQLNGHDRLATRDGTYFNLVQSRCHRRIPQSPGINVYSFALKPEDHQPSGTCNFSRIDNARLVMTLGGTGGSGTGMLSGGVIKVFATNYNVLRVMSGMGGLAYSN